MLCIYLQYVCVYIYLFILHTHCMCIWVYTCNIRIYTIKEICIYNIYYGVYIYIQGTCRYADMQLCVNMQVFL